MVKSFAIFVRIIFFSLCPYLIVSCNEKQELPDISNIEIDITIERWDQQLFNLKDKQQISEFLHRNPLYSNHFLHVNQYPHDSIAVNYLHDFLNNPASEVLRQEIENVFGSLNQINDELNQAFKYLRSYYPESRIPNIYTAVTGFAGNDLFVSDSAVIIGLDYYLGEGATYRPLEFPKYILKRYSSPYIVPSIFLLMSSGINKTNLEDKTMLAEMIYYGKAYYFTKQVLPQSPDSLLNGYTADEIVDISENQDVIWSHFVENKLLYETSHFIKKKYMDERPKTLEIGDKCPGRVGEWLGWEIVSKYMNANSISLPELMQNPDAQEIFMQSKYKPQAL